MLRPLSCITMFWDHNFPLICRFNIKFSQNYIVRAVRAINALFGRNCSKATKFGPDVDRTLLDRFGVDAKKDIALRRRMGYIPNGRYQISEKLE